MLTKISLFGQGALASSLPDRFGVEYRAELYMSANVLILRVPDAE